MCPHLVRLAINHCPDLQNIHWSQLRRSQYPPYMWINRIHVEDDQSLRESVVAEAAASGSRTTLIENFQNTIDAIRDIEGLRDEVGVDDNGAEDDLLTIGDIVEQ